MERVRIHFLGASGTVTGSKFLLETSEATILIDCGLFQGLKELRALNWEYLPIPASEIDLVLLTHGHLDHVGYLPRLYNQGFRRSIIGTSPTLRVAEVILRDSAKIQEEDAEDANAKGYNKHHPAEPLYTVEDVENTLTHFKAAEVSTWHQLSEHISYRFQYNGHIIGATFIELSIFGKIFVFSGDIGRQEDVLLNPPKRPLNADYLFLESTYGDRNHPEEDVPQLLMDLIHDTLEQQGVLLIPSFAVERTQSLMYLLWELYRSGKIPPIPMVMDSPMGSQILSVFNDFTDWHKLSPQQCAAMCNHFNIVESYAETWETIDDPRPKLVIAGSGMITGGRILTYLQQLLDVSTTHVLLVGFMAEGTRGRDLLEGKEELKIHGKQIPVQASVSHLESLSAHADKEELLAWVSELKNIPEQVFLIHGEAEAAAELKKEIESRYQWHVNIPELYEIREIIIGE